jgi:hypothetical protein
LVTIGKAHGEGAKILVNFCLNDTTIFPIGNDVVATLILNILLGGNTNVAAAVNAQGMGSGTLGTKIGIGV